MCMSECTAQQFLWTWTRGSLVERLSFSRSNFSSSFSLLSMRFCFYCHVLFFHSLVFPFFFCGSMPIARESLYYEWLNADVEEFWIHKKEITEKLARREAAQLVCCNHWTFNTCSWNRNNNSNDDATTARPILMCHRFEYTMHVRI